MRHTDPELVSFFRSPGDPSRTFPFLSPSLYLCRFLTVTALAVSECKQPPLSVMGVLFQKTGVWSVDYIPKGVRFGPLVGESRSVNADSALMAPTEASDAGGDRSSPAPLESPAEWKILSPTGGRILKTVHVTDDSKCNWMKYVSVAETHEKQNLVACQVRLFGVFYI